MSKCWYRDIFSHSREYESFKNDLCGRLIGAFVMLGKEDIDYLLKIKGNVSCMQIKQMKNKVFS